MSDQPPPPSQGSGTAFCAECGAAMPADARFCGSCGAAPPVPDPPAADPTATIPAAAAGASTWQGVQSVVDPPAPVPIQDPPAGGPPAGGPPTGGPPAGGPPAGGPPTEPEAKKSKTPLIIIGVVVLAALIGAAFLLLGGGDDDEGDDGFNRDEAAEEEETTTTEADEETTTTTEAEATTTTVADPLAGITFVQVQDATNTLVVEVPDTWVVDGAPLSDGSPNILASPDPAGIANLTSSGLSYTLLSGTPDPDAAIDARATQAGLDTLCTVAEPRQDYTDGTFTGRSQLFDGCGPSGATIIEIVAARADGATVEVTTAIVDPDPIEIFTRIQTTFNLTT